VAIDITDRKKAEQLQKEKEEAEKLSGFVKAISGCIAHEIRTPLAIVGVNVDNLKLVLKNSSANAEQKNEAERFLKNIKFAVSSGSHIITMLLTKLHGVFNETDFVATAKFELVLIKHCINDAIKEYPFYNKESEVMVWDDQLNEGFTCRGDKVIVKQMLFNLIKNALWAIKEAGHGKIYINLKIGKDFNCLLFRDTALGVTPKAIETIFEPFAGHRKDSSGLGLAFCKIVMQLHGGAITSYSKEGEYTEFVLSFPAADVATQTRQVGKE
jgi:Signal transduction histidine kinase